MSNDELQGLVDRLKYFNEWRRGGDGEMPHPKVIGRDIDSAISFIESHIKQKVKNPKTRNSYSSVVNRQMTEQQLKLQSKLRKEGVDWREIDKRVNEL